MNAYQVYAGIDIKPPMVKCRKVLNGLYSSPSIYCAVRSPHKYTTRDVPSWVIHGFCLCARAYPVNATDRGPNRSHRGRGGVSVDVDVAVVDPSLLLTTEDLSAGLSTAVDLCRFVWEKNC